MHHLHIEATEAVTGPNETESFTVFDAVRAAGIAEAKAVRDLLISILGSDTGITSDISVTSTPITDGDATVCTVTATLDMKLAAAVVLPDGSNFASAANGLPIMLSQAMHDAIGELDSVSTRSGTFRYDTSS